MLTCKQFLQDLNDYLGDTLDAATRETLQKHVDECPNCWVVCDTTAKTLKVFKGFEAKAVPPDIHNRLMAALEKKMQEEGPCCRRKKHASDQAEPDTVL